MLEKLNPMEYGEVYQILHDSFPCSERRTYEGQKALLNNQYYEIYVRHIEKQIAAFIALWDFGDFFFVEHFAVHENFRNRGLGGEILSEILRLKHKPSCLEVELPQTELAKRRIEFYKRLGFHLLAYDYIQPPLQVGEKALPLLMMSYPNPMMEKEFLIVKNKLYFYVYGKT